MKKLIPSIALVLLCSTVLLYYACDKKDLANNNRLQESNRISASVVTWLDAQKLLIRNKSTENIDLLKSNLDYEQFHYEELYESKRLLIIPIRKGLAIQKKIDPNRVYNFVAIVDQSGNIVRGNVVIFQPNDASHKQSLPVNTISGLYNSRKIGVDGQFRMVHISGNLLYLMDVKKGRPFSWGRYKLKEQAAQGVSMAKAPCTDYYLVITYYENGEVVNQTYKYIGKVCESQLCDPDYEAYCSGGDGSGGGTPAENPCCLPDPNFRLTIDNTPSDYTMSCGLESVDPFTGKPTKTCIFSWTFNTNNLFWYTWKYISLEQGILEKEFNVWKFRSFAHKSMSKSGAAPPCVIPSCTINAATPSLDATRSTSRMNLYFTSSISYCTPYSTPSSQTFSVGRNFTHRG